jgi:hypothetical protein
MMLSLPFDHTPTGELGVQITFQLFDAVFAFGLFDFDDDFGRFFDVIRVNDNICSFGSHLGSEVNALFHASSSLSMISPLSLVFYPPCFATCRFQSYPLPAAMFLTAGGP